ncbi:tetratricopeptide repeat protein [Luteimonas sp. A478]
MDVRQLEAMLAKGRDSALLRFSLGKHHLDAKGYAQAVAHLDECVSQDPGYSAGWNLLGKAQLGMDNPSAARQAWEKGLAAAERKGDVQAAKVMTVFLRRLDKPKRLQP